MSLNAWPSHKMELYDGWILRFSYFYTHRTNSVEQFGNSTLTWREKIPYCESVYRRLGTPAVTARGMNAEDMDVIAEAIALMLNDAEANQEKAKALVKGLTEKYPLI